MTERSQTMPCRPTRRCGFAVVLALMLMSVTILLLLALAVLARVDLQIGIAVRQLQEARTNALFAMEEALGTLQAAAGPDAVATARADLLYDGGPDSLIPILWSGALRADEDAIRWLVSGLDNAGGSAGWSPPGSADRVFLGEGVWAPRIVLRSGGSGPESAAREIGAYAWWVGDEGVKAPVGTRGISGDTAPGQGVPDLPAVQQEMRLFSDLSGLWPEFSRAEAGPFLDRLRTARQVELLPGVDADARGRSAAHYTTLSRALLTNAATGGWRVNLDDPGYMDEWIGGAVREWLESAGALRNPEDGLDGGAHYPDAPRVERSDRAAAELPVAHGAPWNAPLPVITELKLSVGFFHAHGSDRRHRARFHVEAEFWNPYGIPMEMSSGDPRGYRGMGARGFIIVWDGLPAYTIENLDTGASFHFDMSAFDTALLTNEESHSLIHGWTVFRDGLLLPGEVYHLIEPDPEHQEEGLQRRISDTAWIWSESGERPAGAVDGNWLAPGHTIRFTPDRSDHGVTVSVFAFRGAIPASMHPMDYGDPVLVLRNIPYRAEPFILFGSEYTRRFSLEYSRADYRVAWYLRLRDDPENLAAMIDRRDPRDPVWDLSDPGVAALFSIEADPRATVMREDYFSALDPVFFDGRANSHRSDGESRFGDFRLFDVPARAPLSIGALRHIPLRGMPPYSIGSPRGGLWNTLFDRCFFAGSQVPENGAGAMEPRNPRLRRIGDRSAGLPEEGFDANAASGLEIATPFNLQSASVHAWAAVLSEAIADWRMSGTVVGPGEVPVAYTASDTLESPIFRRSFSAQFGPGLVHDSDGTGGAIPASQGLRSLDRPGAVRDLAEAIVEALRTEAQRRGRPFRSLAELINSGVIEEAIARSGLNEGIPAHLPAHLNQSDLVALLAPFATIRSDTFVIRAYGESVHGATGRAAGRAWCEAVVQRRPEYVVPGEDSETHPDALLDPRNQALGRRFVVTRFHWLSREDL